MAITDDRFQWVCTPFAQLSAAQWYDIVRLRELVFIVEQNCPYLDADGKDCYALHLCAYDTVENHRLAAYCRLLPTGVSYAEASIGRVVNDPAYRRLGLGKILMRQGIHYLFAHLGGIQPIRISAQQYLERFYESLGFITQSDPYLEDNIPHIEMLRKVEEIGN